LSVQVRRAARDDLVALLALEEQFPGDRISRASFRRWLVSPTGDVWVAVRAGEGGERVVGDALVAYRRNSSGARLMSLVADASERRQGVAAALLQVAEEAARERGARRMRLEVRCDNDAAIALYQRSGYRLVARLGGYYQDGADGWRMEKRFAPASR